MNVPSFLKTPWPWLALLFVVGVGGGMALGSWQNLCHDCPSVAQIYTWEPQQTSKVYSADGVLLAELGIERRTPVPIRDLPPHVPQAFLAIEDRRFYRHNGVDLRGITRAAIGATLNRSFAAGGGSTITQQLARNMFETIGFEKRVERKLKELQVALELERAYSKDQILEAYMNQINFDRGWYGIQTAARNYFGKPAVELNPAEAAMLAAIANRPAYYNPLRNPEPARQRRNLVLTAMVDEGFLSEEEGEEWREYPLPDRRAELEEDPAPYFVEWVRRTLDARYGRLLYTGGLEIHTTLDSRMQRAARISMKNGFQTLEARPGYPHPKYEEYAQQTTQFEGTNSPYMQGLLVALDHKSGEVRALVGGRDFNHSRFNRVTQALRQPGSSFKPLVYAAAINSGIPASHVIVDAPVVMPQVSGEDWRPQNFTGEFGGPMTIRAALRQSINMVAIKLAVDEVGLETVVQTARRLGIRTDIPRFPSTAIGAPDVIPLQIAEAYGTFANLGTRVRPHFILRVESAEGEVLWEPERERTEALDPLVSRVMVSLLEDVVIRGTGYNGVRNVAQLPQEVPAAGKTGTTNDATDVWFAGFTPDLTAVVWFGMDQPQRIRTGATGGGDASPVWGEFMRRVYYGEDADNEKLAASRVSTQDGNGRPEGTVDVGGVLPIPSPWPMLQGLVVRRVDSLTGLLASRWCPADRAYDEIFISGTEPTELCDESGVGLFDLQTRPW
ncbi:MAG: PBP1A family penicillin-binding protein [Gemmatimonadota bacterium]